jgi:hypothetical protein
VRTRSCADLPLGYSPCQRAIEHSVRVPHFGLDEFDRRGLNDVRAFETTVWRDDGVATADAVVAADVGAWETG